MIRVPRRLLPLFVFAIAAAAAASGNVSPAVAGGGCRGVPSTSAEGAQVKMTGHACFSPTVLYAQPGTTVTWTNESADIHDVAGATLEWGDYDEIRAGASRSFTFAAPGTYPYYCFLHPGMVGAVVVGDGRAAGGSTPAAANIVAPAAAAQMRARESLAESDRAEPSAGSAIATRAESNELLFAALGALIGAVAVGLGVGARSLRR